MCPTSTKELPPGTRLCAYWSQQYRCLYPGTSVEPTEPDPQLDERFVSVEFDDGDSGRIALDDIRLLQPDYPVVGESRRSNRDWVVFSNFLFFLISHRIRSESLADTRKTSTTRLYVHGRETIVVGASSRGNSELDEQAVDRSDVRELPRR